MIIILNKVGSTVSVYIYVYIYCILYIIYYILYTVYKSLYIKPSGSDLGLHSRDHLKHPGLWFNLKDAWRRQLFFGIISGLPQFVMGWDNHLFNGMGLYTSNGGYNTNNSGYIWLYDGIYIYFWLVVDLPL